jgi:DNA-binding NarL/FixJ family response regulator
MTIKVLIADDHSVVRQGLQTFLGLDPELEVVGVAVNGEEVLELAQQLQPQVILLDLMMPGMDGFAAITALRRQLPVVTILVLTSMLEHESISRALREGANGYLLKNMEGDKLCQTIKAAASGQVLLSPEVAQQLVHQAGAASSNEMPNLTERETEVLRLVAQGKANKEIAYALGLSEKTVKVHVSIILAKLGLQGRTQAALYATRIGLVPSTPPVEEGFADVY